MLTHHPKGKKATSLGLVINIGGNTNSSPKAQCTVNFIQIGLFFCLRSCKYTKAASHRHTTQFWFRDTQFHNTAGVIPGDALDQTFLDAWATTLFLDTQKNCVQVESTSMESTSL